MYNIIANECSGNSKGSKVLKITKDYFTQKNLPFIVYSTDSVGHAKLIATKITESGEETKIIIIGGDGTFHEVVNGITDFDKAVVGFVPGGRGNDFVRATGISKKTVTALDNILKGEEQRIDVLQIDNKKSLNIAGTGLDIEVLELVIRKKYNGKLGYVRGLIECLRHFNPYKIKIKMGDEVLEREVILVTTCSGAYFGGGIHISPLSKVNDGIMNLVVINMVKRARIPFIFIQFLKGRHILPKMANYAEHFKCESVEIENASSNKIQLDGEIYENLQYKASILKGVLRVVGLPTK